MSLHSAALEMETWGDKRQGGGGGRKGRGETQVLGGKPLGVATISCSCGDWQHPDGGRTSKGGLVHGAAHVAVQQGGERDISNIYFNRKICTKDSNKIVAKLNCD